MTTDNDALGRMRPAAAPESPVVAALTDLNARLSAETGDFDEFDGPIYWPTREPERAEWDWPSLAQWVERLRARFPHMTARIPECWYLHNDLVEALLALRDHERASYASTAPGSAAVEWHRAFRDMEARWDSWIKRYTCTIPGKGHPPALDGSKPHGFAEFVKADLARRQAVADNLGAQSRAGRFLRARHTLRSLNGIIRFGDIESRDVTPIADYARHGGPQRNAPIRSGAIMRGK